MGVSNPRPPPPLLDPPTHHGLLLAKNPSRSSDQTVSLHYFVFYSIRFPLYVELTQLTLSIKGFKDRSVFFLHMILSKSPHCPFICLLRLSNLILFVNLDFFPHLEMQFFPLNLCCRLVLSDVIVLGSLRSHVERVEKTICCR